MAAAAVTNNNKNDERARVFIEGDVWPRRRRRGGGESERVAAADIQYWHPLTPTY